MITTFNAVDFANLNSSKQAPETKSIITADNFAESLNRQIEENYSETAANKTEEDISEQDTEFDNAMSVIKEKGIMAYIMEQHAKKVREEVMELLGVTEEALAKMNPKERSAMEKRIAEEVKKRLEAESYMQKQNNKFGAAKAGMTAPGYNALNIIDIA